MATIIQARARTRPAVSSSTFLLFLIVAVGVMNVGHSKSSPPTYLLVYDHQNTVPPNNTAVLSASTGSSPFSFGSISVISNILRETADPNSAVLGEIVGEVIVVRNSFYINAMLVLDIPGYSGGIATQGTSDFLGNGELAITGGTGDFRYAKGHQLLRSTGKVAPEDMVFEIELFIDYDY